MGAGLRQTPSATWPYVSYANQQRGLAQVLPMQETYPRTRVGIVDWGPMPELRPFEHERAPHMLVRVHFMLEGVISGLREDSQGPFQI